MNIDMKICENTSSARLALRGIDSNIALHGISDGSWSLVDAIREMCHICGPSDVVLSTWTAANANLLDAERMIKSRIIRNFRLCVDRSFQSRQPKYCAAARSIFGDECIRIWSSHAKFCIVMGDNLRILYLTSANLNRNKRLESFTAIANDELVDQYLTMVDQLFVMQKPGEGFEFPAVGRQHTERILS